MKRLLPKVLLVVVLSGVLFNSFVYGMIRSYESSRSTGNSLEEEQERPHKIPRFEETVGFSRPDELVIPVSSLKKRRDISSDSSLTRAPSNTSLVSFNPTLAILDPLLLKDFFRFCPKEIKNYIMFLLLEKLWDGHFQLYKEVSASLQANSLIALNKDGTVLCIAKSTCICVINLEENKGFGVPLNQNYSVQSVQLSADGNSSFVSLESDPLLDNTVLLANFSNLPEVLKTFFKGPYGAVINIALSPDEQTLLIASKDGNVSLLDLFSGEQKQFFKGNTAEGLCVVFSADGRYCLTGEWDGKVNIWESPSGRHFRSFEAGKLIVNVAFCDKAGMVLAVGISGMLYRWEIHSNFFSSTCLKNFSSSAKSVSFSPDGELLASWLINGDLALSDSLTGKQLRILAQNVPESKLFFSKDGTVLGAISRGKGIVLWRGCKPTALKKVHIPSNSFAFQTFKLLYELFYDDQKREVSDTNYEEENPAAWGN